MQRINKNQDAAKGTLSTFNTMVDIGLDFNSFLMGMGGLVVKENNATPFISFNAGYSFGYSIIGNQKYSDPRLAADFLARQNERTKFNDPSLSKSGFVSAWYIGTDIGATQFRLSWYKYRNAPLANNIQISAAWRFLHFGGRK